MYFAANDAPVAVANQMKDWGLCADEFKENEISPHWPPSLYIREARRMLGEQVFNQNTPAYNVTVNSIGLGHYNFDSHNVIRFYCRNKSACHGSGPENASESEAYVWNEGDVEINPGLYEIPRYVMLPKEAESENLLVVSALSASHIGLSTLRMEPQFMIIGHAAGVNAALAIQGHTSVQRVSEKQLSEELKMQGAKLSVIK